MSRLVTSPGNRKMFEIDSEPGDGTRYNYIVMQYDDEFIFTPLLSSFKFPNRIERWQLEGMESGDRPSEKEIELAEEFKCNPWTVRECVRSIRELFINP